MIELNVLQNSPLDDESISTSNSAGGDGANATRDMETLDWSPSRFNARAVDADGKMIVWNSRTGNISVFEPEKAPLIDRALRQTGFSARRAGIVEYLNERGYIHSSREDESQAIDYEVSRQHHRQDVLHLILLASEDCDFRCVYCYEDFARGTMIPEIRDGVKRYLEKKVPHLSLLRINWFGGEPLYGFEAIQDIAPFARDLAEAHDVQFVSSMTTNGYQLTQPVAEQLFDWDISTFQITLDGTPEDHNQKRVARDGSETFDTIYDNLTTLRDTENDFTITLRSNFDQDSHPNFSGYLDRLRDDFAGDDRFKLRFRAVGEWGGPNDDSMNTCGLGESREVKQRLREYARERGLNVDQGLDLKGGLGNSVCYAGRPFSFIVGAHGQLMKCTIVLDSADHNIVGHITPEGEMNLDADRMGLWTNLDYHKDDECDKCQVMPLCQGMSCPLVRIESNDEDKSCLDVRWQLKDKLKETRDRREDQARGVTVVA